MIRAFRVRALSRRIRDATPLLESETFVEV
jgi:hypothetical protein